MAAAQLHKWLIEDGHEVFLDQDLRDGIAIGEEWEQRLYERLRWADAVVCLVTSSYRDSAWCAAEVGIARSQGSRLLPLRGEPGQVHPLLMPSQYQYADMVGDPVAARATLREALRRLDVVQGWGWPDGRSPFPGLQPFGTDLHRVFFGRSTEVDGLAARLRSPAAFADGTMLLIVGPSGCGKSSLVRAGLLPAMAVEPDWQMLPPMTPGADPVGTLARELAHAAKELELRWSLSFVRDRLDHDDGLALLTDDLLLEARGRARRVLLIVDQFEELLTVSSVGARAQFAHLLRPAMAGSVQVVGTLRPEFLGDLLGSPELVDLPTRTFPLRPLRREALATVIEGPAKVADIDVDPELVARLVADTHTGEALPLLAFTLSQLAEDVGRGGKLSVARYDQLGGVQGALITQADAALADALAVNHRTPNQVVAGLLQLVSVNERGQPVRWPIDRNELPTSVRGELDAFTARRLLTADVQDNGTVVLGVTHEAFLTAWPPLAAAISAAAAGLRARRAVELAAGEWEEAGRPSLRLWERGQLAAALRDTGARRVAHTSEEDLTTEPRLGLPRRSYLQPWRRRVLATEKVELSPHARDFLDRSIRKDRSRRWRATTVLSVLLAFAMAAAAVAVVQQGAAQQQLRIATARQLISEASGALNDDPLEALQLGVAAQAIHDDAETRASLVTSLISTRYVGALKGHGDLVGALAFSSDGKMLVSGADDNTWRVWDFTDHGHPTALGEPHNFQNWVTALAVSPDGKIVVCGSAEHTVRLWSLVDPRHPVPLGPPLQAHKGRIRGVAFADMNTLITAGEDGTVRVWDITNPHQPAPLGEPLAAHSGGPVRAIAISQKRQLLATGGKDFMVRLWSLADRRHLVPLGHRLEGHDYPVRSLAFSPDGNLLASASDDHKARLWNVADRDHPGPLGGPLGGHEDEVTSVAFSPDGSQVATGSDDQTVRRWSVVNPAKPIPLSTLTGPHNEVYSVAYSPDGSMLTAGVRDGSIVMWNIADGTLPAPLGPPLSGHHAGIDPVVFSPTARFLATASEDTTVKFWQWTDRTRPSLISTLRHDYEVMSAAFSPDKPDLFVTGTESTIQFWNVSDPAHPAPLGPLIGDYEEVVSLAFCRGKDVLVSGEEGGDVTLWKLTDPADPVRLGKPLKGNDVEVDSVACSPDGRILAVAGKDTVKLWDLTDEMRPKPLDRPLPVGHQQAVNSVTFSADGKTMATAGDDGAVTLWDFTDRASPIPLGPALRAHGDPVTSVAFDPTDGRIMATASDDQTARLWDLTDRARPVPLAPPLEGHQRAVNSVAIGPSGMVATGSDDGTARLWDLRTLDAIRKDPMKYACERIGQGFDRDEWSSQIPPLPYQETCPR
jgi:WD40 repeat protein/ABC-type nitrate/sulfonate/bicarbonate transport system ATPase subunit